ncbi:prohibitin family protein [Weissella ceti]|uniref:Prohibitin family protein n=1 Tax=Weissella ceti TaxID=759620 RepID=A0ABT3E478_9LACO|nr:prohibitin family protein [Weissella ceti]MCW0953210.1 prohibitin family protein [Weissella ceti]QVK12727.1 prohibitin family protein [Weissella ceti]
MNNAAKSIIAGVVLVGLGIGAAVGLEKVDNGNVGIMYSMNGGVKDEPLSQGVHWVGLKQVTQYPVKTQTYEDKVTLSTKDGKKFDMPVTYSYNVDQSKAVEVYKKFGSQPIESIEKGWLKQQLISAGRSVVSQYNVLDVMSEDATKMQGDLLKAFQDKVEKTGFNIEDVSTGTPDLDDQTKKSIDGLIIAGQDNKKAELNAKSTQTNAEAEKKAEITKAEGKAKANELLSASVTDKTIADKEADARMQWGWIEVQTGEAIVDTTKK